MSSDEGTWDPSGDEEDDSTWATPKLGGKKMERCLVGKQEIMLPEALTEQVYCNKNESCTAGFPFKISII